MFDAGLAREIEVHGEALVRERDAGAVGGGRDR
jgi:hypothetical protein